MLNLLRPHLIQAYGNAEMLSQLHQENTLLRQAVEESGRGVIVVNDTGRIQSCTERARRWLEAYCGHLPHTGEWLPVEVRQWFLQQQAQWTQRDDVPPPSTPLILEREGQQLRLRILPNTSGEQHMLLLEERVTLITPAALEALGLSRREAEVLYWLVQGKTNPEIGTILHLRPSTVQTYVIRLYQKLGVETRNAATLHVLERLGLVYR
jgi:DNA-binding CsgD family transcriptional regulator